MAALIGGEIGSKLRIQATKDLDACAFATALWNTDKILSSVGWNLFKIMTMFDIEVSPPAAAQILLFIQDGLDDLRNMPEAPPEKQLVGGEVSVFEGGKKIASKDLTVHESDLVIEEGQA